MGTAFGGGARLRRHLRAFGLGNSGAAPAG